MTIRFLVRIPDGKYCSSSRLRCPCLSIHEGYDDCCQLFGTKLKDNDADYRCFKCDACAKKGAKIRQEEAGV